MTRILIADKVPTFSKMVAERLPDMYEVCICEDGEQVLQQCRLWQPDYMLLDLELPLVDGLTILRTLYSSGQNVKIMAKTSCVQSNYVGQSLVQLGVEYILPNPCTVTEAVSQLNSLMQHTIGEYSGEDNGIISMLLHLGFNYNMGGFSCVCEALRMVMEDVHLPITKVIYPQVARVCGGTAARVERAIRNAIDKAWRNRDDRIWQYYFPTGRNGQIACPTNGEFLCRVALCMTQRKIV